MLCTNVSSSTSHKKKAGTNVSKVITGHKRPLKSLRPSQLLTNVLYIIDNFEDLKSFFM